MSTIPPIPLTDLIAISSPKQYKLHVARDNGDQPLDVYAESYEEWRKWNTWRGKKFDDFNEKYIFSLIDFYHESNMWLFGGIFEVISRGKPWAHSYEIEEQTEYSHYVGRLKISLNVNAKSLNRIRSLKLEKHIGNMKVSEILKSPYSGETFPGYEDINHSFRALKTIFKNQHPGWQAALKNVKGVYVVMDKSNGKKYVGSAYGEWGIWSRWSEYMQTGHGWNDELKQLVKEKGIDYAEENFVLSLLEYRPKKTDDKDIIHREQYWKEVFLSTKFGYNKK